MCVQMFACVCCCRPPERPAVVAAAPPPPEKKEKILEPFLIGLSPSTIEFKLGARISRLLEKYRARKGRVEKRQEEVSAILLALRVITFSRAGACGEIYIYI